MKIRYEERAVAFIDVLGFGTLANDAASDQDKLSELEGVNRLLKSAIPTLDQGVNSTVPKELIPIHNQISDCIILSAPMATQLQGWKHYSGLEIVLMRISQLTHRFLEAGYLLQGGIDVGPVWHTEDNIIGPAYQCAFHIETTNSNPSLVLSDRAAERFRANATNRIAIEYASNTIANGLHSAYFPNNSGTYETKYRRYQEIVQAKIDTLTDRPRDKWQWFKQYLDFEFEQQCPGYQQALRENA